MKRRTLIPALLLTAGTNLAFADGAISGRVLNDSKQIAYAGAIVRIDELERQVTADENGNFYFNAVPAGSYTISVDYVGAKATTINIDVADKQVADQLITMKALGNYEEVVVYGQAAGTARSINKQRGADNLINVVSAEGIGKLPDANVAEALQRVPGVFLERDQGEGRFIGLRGLDPNLNLTQINGINVPSPENDRRSVALDVIPSDLVGGLEVTKTVTPDQDNATIGGIVNIKGLSAFDRGGQTFSITAENSYAELVGE